MFGGDEDLPAPAPTKRSFFSKPTWASQQTRSERRGEDGTEMFSHANDTFAAIMKEQERKDKEKVARKEKKKQQAEKRKSDSDHAEDKRRRMSLEVSDESDTEISKPLRKESEERSKSRTPAGARRSPRPLTRTYNATTAKPSPQKQSTVIDLLGSESEPDDLYS
ncbi:hypothetical protein LTS18_003712, partial [Coniosporium uncinatum]